MYVIYTPWQTYININLLPINTWYIYTLSSWQYSTTGRRGMEATCMHAGGNSQRSSFDFKLTIWIHNDSANLWECIIPWYIWFFFTYYMYIPYAICHIHSMLHIHFILHIHFTSHIHFMSHNIFPYCIYTSYYILRSTNHLGQIHCHWGYSNALADDDFWGESVSCLWVVCRGLWRMRAWSKMMYKGWVCTAGCD